MSELVQVAEEQKGELEALMGKLREFAQPRSAYTIEKHIVCAQETPEMQYKQVLDELWARLNSLQDVMDERELAEMELEEKEDGGPGTGDRRREIEIRKLRRKLVRIDYKLEGLTREIGVLLSIKERLPEFTWEQFEASQERYWEKRLARQWWLTHIAGGNYGNLDAILNLFTPLGEDRPQVGRLADAAGMMELDGSKLVAGSSWVAGKAESLNG